MNECRPENHIKILFKFGDNDFGTTFRLVFHQLHEKWIEDSYDFYHPKEKLEWSKEYICDFINILAWPLYKTRQCHLKLSVENPRFASDKEEEEFYRNYLKATPEKIFLNEEVDEFLEKNINQSNCEWFVLDTKLFNMNVYSI